MTPAEIHAFNQGISLMASIARKSADTIAATDPRRLASGFAIVALRALAEDAAALLIDPGKPDAATSDHPGQAPVPAGSSAAAAEDTL